MTAKITELIETVAGFAVVRNKIAAILAEEIAAQQVLATAGGENPDLWKVRIFTERDSPWEMFLNDPADTSPICHVTFYEGDIDPSSGDLIESQTSQSKFWLDCYGYGVAESEATGHLPGDESSALEATRAVHLIRSILMSGYYSSLDLDEVVTSRKTNRITSYKPATAQGASVVTIQNITVYRLELEVRHCELSPQVVEGILEQINGTVYREDSGEVLASVEYVYEEE